MTDTPTPDDTDDMDVIGWRLRAENRQLQTDLAACRAALREQSVVDVLAERQRQIEREGWTPEHDDAHDEAELALAASAYARHAYDKTRPECWPWDWSWWKPSDPRRDLVKAAALIVAEIERLDRLTKGSL